MTKVLEHGNTHKICTCKMCKCRFEYSELDTHTYTEERNFIWQKPRLKEIYIYCPECGKKNIVEEIVLKGN